jgi:tryptophan synthase beta chain
LILVNLSGRGDKDVDTAISWFGLNTAGTASASAGGATGSGPER